MAKTVKSGGKCWNEGVEVPCPDSMKEKKPVAKKKAVAKKKDKIMDAWEEAKKRQKKWQR
jgi:hypothetical protein